MQQQSTSAGSQLGSAQVQGVAAADKAGLHARLSLAQNTWCSLTGFDIPGCRPLDAKLCPQEPAYLHAEHMYDLKSMKHRKLKFGVACSAIVMSGVVLPAFCVHWQLKKAGG